jgi:hypothetical protein
MDTTTMSTTEEKSLADKIADTYSDRPNLLKAMIKLYKGAFDRNKANWQKTDVDLTRDILEAKFSLDLDGIIKGELEKQSRVISFEARIKMLKVFLEFAYIYYIHYFDNHTPFYELPSTVEKFRIIALNLKAHQTRLHVNVNKLFEKLITNETVKAYVTGVPAYLIQDIDQKEVIDKLLTEVQPICKELLSCLLALEL